MNFTEQQNSNRSSCQSLFNHQDSSCFEKQQHWDLKGMWMVKGVCRFHLNAASISFPSSPKAQVALLKGDTYEKHPAHVSDRAMWLHF